MAEMRVWWIPQLPMTAFRVPVESIEQGRWLLDVLADYDQFQLDHNVKPDYSNMGGIEVWDADEGDWFEHDPDEIDVAPPSPLFSKEPQPPRVIPPLPEDAK